MYPEILEAAKEALAQSHGVREILSTRSVGGGSINDAFSLHTDKGPFFIKINDAGRYPGMFEAEARGLSVLEGASSIRVPEGILTGSAGNHAFILMEYLESGAPAKDFWRSFGRGLAELHRNSSDAFGLDHDNYIGSLPQSNTAHPDWNRFFISERLEPMARMARDKGLADSPLLQSLDRLYRQLGSVFPVEAPSLLHGDLWSGNFMTGPQGEPCIIDPAVYYGFREMDIGMSKLFGGFSGKFYEAYNDAWPMEPGWQGRVDICNLYPLLVHVNLFGAGYIGQVKEVLKRF